MPGCVCMGVMAPCCPLHWSLASVQSLYCNGVAEPSQWNSASHWPPPLFPSLLTLAPTGVRAEVLPSLRTVLFLSRNCRAESSACFSSPPSPSAFEPLVPIFRLSVSAERKVISQRGQELSSHFFQFLTQTEFFLPL